MTTIDFSDTDFSMRNMVYEYETHLDSIQNVIVDVFQDLGDVIFAETDTTYHTSPTYVFGIHIHRPVPRQEILYIDAPTFYKMSSKRLYKAMEDIRHDFQLTFIS